jgi:hypothetical protein
VVEIAYPSLGLRVPSAGPLVLSDERVFATWLPYNNIQGGVLAVDVSDPAHPKAQGAWDPRVTPLPGAGWHSITNEFAPVARNGRLYLSGGPTLLELDVSGETPTYRRDLDTECVSPCDRGGLALRGDSAWVALGQAGLAEVLLDDPSGELVLGRQIATNYPATDVATLDDGRLLVATWYELTVLDPDSGITLATLEEFPVRQIDVEGDRAYALEARAGDGDSRWYFTVLDVANPLAPRVLGSYEMAPFGPHPYAVHREWLYLGAGQSGIERVRMSEVSEPTVDALYLPALRTSGGFRSASASWGATLAAD